MALLGFAVTTEGKIALVATIAKTVLQLVAPTNQRVNVDAITVSFDAAANAQPVLVELLYQTSAGTSSSATPYKTDPGLGVTIQSTARKNATVEPTDSGAVIRRWEVHPQTGLERAFDRGEIVVDGGGRLGLRITAPAGVNVDAGFDGEE